MKKTEFIYNNVKYNSKAELARALGMDRSTLAYRMKKNLPIEKESGKILDLRKIKVKYKGIEYESFTELCQYLDADSDVVKCRMQRGYTLEEAIKKEKKVTKQGRKVLYKGKIYLSIRRLALDKKISESLLRRRINNGWTVEDAVDMPKGYRG